MDIIYEQYEDETYKPQINITENPLNPFNKDFNSSETDESSSSTPSSISQERKVWSSSLEFAEKDSERNSDDSSDSDSSSDSCSQLTNGKGVKMGATDNMKKNVKLSNDSLELVEKSVCNIGNSETMTAEDRRRSYRKSNYRGAFFAIACSAKSPTDKCRVIELVENSSSQLHESPPDVCLVTKITNNDRPNIQRKQAQLQSQKSYDIFPKAALTQTNPQNIRSKCLPARKSMCVNKLYMDTGDEIASAQTLKNSRSKSIAIDNCGHCNVHCRSSIESTSTRPSLLSNRSSSVFSQRLSLLSQQSRPSIVCNIGSRFSKLSFTQKLAFPNPPETQITHESYPYYEAESWLDMLAKFITYVVLAFVIVVSILAVYRMFA